MGMKKIEANANIAKEKTLSEDREQMLFIQWFRRNYADIVIFHIPNGGYRRPSEAARLKAMGVTAGVPDLFIPKWDLFIEMKKSKGGKLSLDQNLMIAYLESVGYKCLVGYGFEDIKMKIENMK